MSFKMHNDSRAMLNIHNPLEVVNVEVTRLFAFQNSKQRMSVLCQRERELKISILSEVSRNSDPSSQ